MRYRRWSPRYDPNVKATVNVSESYRGHAMQIFVSRNSEATMTCAVYIDGKQAAFDVIVGNEAEVLVVGVTTAMRTIDGLVGDIATDVVALHGD